MLSSDSTDQAAPPITYSTPTNLLALNAVMQAMKPVCDLQAAEALVLTKTVRCTAPKWSPGEYEQHSIITFDVAASPHC